MFSQSNAPKFTNSPFGVMPIKYPTPILPNSVPASKYQTGAIVVPIPKPTPNPFYIPNPPPPPIITTPPPVELPNSTPAPAQTPVELPNSTPTPPTSNTPTPSCNCEKSLSTCNCPTPTPTPTPTSTPTPIDNNKYMYIVGGLIIAFFILNKK